MWTVSRSRPRPLPRLTPARALRRSNMDTASNRVNRDFADPLSAPPLGPSGTARTSSFTLRACLWCVPPTVDVVCHLTEELSWL